MSLSIFGVGKAVCDATFQMGWSSIAQTACFQPSSIGTLVVGGMGGTIIFLAYRYWRISAP